MIDEDARSEACVLAIAPELLSTIALYSLMLRRRQYPQIPQPWTCHPLQDSRYRPDAHKAVRANTRTRRPVYILEAN